MHFNIFKTVAWQLIIQSDPMCWFILLALFTTSVFCIAITAFKYFLFRAEHRKFEALTQRMKAVRSFTDLINASKEFRDGVGGRFLLVALSELKILLDAAGKKKQAAVSDDATPHLSDRDIVILESELVSAAGRLVIELEAYMPILSTSAVTAPLVGLFGTIWGLIHSFIDISQEKSADIATVAPGLAEALIVTLAGLIVAIPSLIAFHYFATHVRKFEHQLNDLGDRFLNIAKQTFIK
jgi:biopolymer transport protein TolQ